MAYWNCRVMLKDGHVAVHEVYYNDNGEVEGYTRDPVAPSGETLEELTETFEKFKRALTEPVLDYAQLEAEAAQARAEQG